MSAVAYTAAANEFAIWLKSVWIEDYIAIQISVASSLEIGGCSYLVYIIFCSINKYFHIAAAYLAHGGNIAFECMAVKIIVTIFYLQKSANKKGKFCHEIVYAKFDESRYLYLAVCISTIQKQRIYYRFIVAGDIIHMA